MNLSIPYDSVRSFRVKLEAAHRLLDQTQWGLFSHTPSTPEQRLFLADEAMDLIADVKDALDCIDRPEELTSIVNEGKKLAKQRAAF